MGLYDHVKTDHPEFVCSEGHRLTLLQTKDFDCVMGDVRIAADGKVTFSGGPMGMPWPNDARGYLGRINVYDFCPDCPAYVAPGTFNVHHVWVEFEVEIINGVVRSIQRISGPTAEEIANTLALPHMKEAVGPMSPIDAGIYAAEQRAARDRP